MGLVASTRQNELEEAPPPSQDTAALHSVVAWYSHLANLHLHPQDLPTDPFPLPPWGPEYEQLGYSQQVALGYRSQSLGESERISQFHKVLPLDVIQAT